MTLDTSGIIGQSPALQEVFAILAKVAPTESTVLVSGESGTGKKLMVRALHHNSKRNQCPFVPINCGAIPGELLESELFGHEKDAFTHALRTQAGRFELAEGGTIFLDEIEAMDLSLQVKILRVLQEKKFERVGGNKTFKANVRIIAATNRNLEQEVAKGTFREDLYYRLNVIPVHLPPLRERQEDIPLLANYFLQKFCQKQERTTIHLSPAATDILLAYSWPGNVRELKNFMERLSIICEACTITPNDLPDKILKETGADVPKRPHPQAVSNAFRWPTIKDMHDQNLSLKEFFDFLEINMLKEALNMADGVKNQAAEILGIKRTTLIEKLKKKQIS
ncbi:MAG: sigma-54 dependent transcriptional regulator [Desulfoplanes sp.]|nr:sigma-54 dependent transcriptional regulator [Desulfoplanes sp.]